MAGNLNHGSDAVAPGLRMSKGSLTMAWWAVCSAMFYLFVAATLASAYGTVNAIIGMALSVVCYGLINAVIARYAIRTGLSVALFSRVLFGHAGSALATLIVCATAIYYAVFEGSVIAVAIADYAPGIGYALASLIVVLYSVPLVFGGVQRWLDKFNGALLPFYLIGLLGAVALAVARFGYSDAWLELGPAGGAPAHGWWPCFTAYMGVWVLMMYTFDYARFGRPEDAGYHARFNFGMPFYLVAFLLNGVAGIFLVGTMPAAGALSETGIVLALLELMGLGGLVFVWVTQTRINTANYHVATANLQAFAEKLGAPRLPTAVWAIVVGALAYALMRADVFAYILQALAYQGVFVTAWVAIALTHILSPAYGRLFGERIELERVPAFNPCGLAAWFGGAGLGIALMHAGPAAAGFATPATALAAAAVYAALLARAKRRWFVREAAVASLASAPADS